MFDNFSGSFVLGNSLTAVSAFFDEDSNIIATDGFECKIHKFDENGNFSSYRETLRAYRRLRPYSDGQSYTAIGCCNTPRVYFIDENFREDGYIDLETRRGNSKPLTELTDASAVKLGDEDFIIGAFRSGAYLFDLSGRRLTRLCTVEQQEVLTDFISAGNDVFAMTVLCGNTQTLTVADAGCVQSITLPRSLRLRMLFARENEIYALFSRSYIYNRIEKIYSKGILRLPKA